MRVNIIGAGITGLSAAYFLTKKGHSVRVFDYTREVGGLAGSFPVEGTFLEKYYHHIFKGHLELIELIKELDLEKELFFQKVKMGFYYKGCIYPFISTKDLLSFTPLKMRDRIRLGLSSLLMMCIKDWQSMEKKSAMEWQCKYSGDESCRIIWKPLLKMKFGDDFDRISAAWLWNRVVDRKKSKERGGGKEVLGYIKGGYKILFDALLEQISANGSIIHTKMPIDEVVVEKGECLGVKSSDSYFEGDIVLSTVPIPSFLHMAPSLPKEYVNRLSSINYQGSLCLVLKLKKTLSDYYWISVSDPDAPFVGIIEHTNFVAPENYGNSHLVYLTKYSSSKDPIFSGSKEEIYNKFVTYLKNVFPAFQDENVDKYWVFKDLFSQPIFVKNYSKIMPDITTPIKNLYLLNTSQIYPQSRCLNSSIVKAQEIVKEMERNNGK